MIPDSQNQAGQENSFSRGVARGTNPIQFLRELFREKPWPLVAIRKPAFRAETFEPIVDRDKRAEDWIEGSNGSGFDIYFSINPLKKTGGKKAKKEDVACAEYLWGDLDHLKGADLDIERREMLSLLTDRRLRGMPEPTLVIDSGRGFWAFWKLRTPHPVDGDGPQTERIESYGRGLERVFGARADGCRNIDRVARLPGTTNHKTGRQSKVISYKPENVYDLTDFPPPEQAHDETARKNKPGPGRQRATYFDTRETVDVDKLSVSDAIKHVIRTGKYPNQPGRYPSRSEAVMAVLVAMVATGCSDNTMSTVMLDTCLPIGDHIRDQSYPIKYVRRQIEKARTMARASGRESNARDGRTPPVVLNSQRKELRSCTTCEG
jgi:hypothetical protein